MTNHFHSLTWVAAVIAFFAATSATAKGKPNNDPPPPPPVNYDITWFELGELNVSDLFSVDRQGTTIVGAGVKPGVRLEAVTIDVNTTEVTNLNDIVSSLDPTQLPPEWQSSWYLSSAYRVSDQGVIAGHLTDHQGQLRLFTFEANAANPFHVFGEAGADNIIRDMNGAGDILYETFVAGASTSHIYTDGQQTISLPPELLNTRALNDDLMIAGNLGGTWSNDTAYLYDVNADQFAMIDAYFNAFDVGNDGTVVGRGALKDKGPDNLNALQAIAYTTEDGKFLLDEDGKGSDARAINDAGQVVGRIYSGKIMQEPDTSFFYDPVAGFWSLNDLIEDTPEDTAFWLTGDQIQSANVSALTEPLVNGYPLIVGSKRVPGSLLASSVDTTFGFILTPFAPSAASASAVPEPPSLALLVVGMAPLAFRLRKEQTRLSNPS